MNSAIISPQIARAASDLRAVLGRLKRRLRQPDDADEITLPQASVLSRLAREGPMSPGALAAADHVRPQSMSTTLAALEAQGLVARRADPADGRRVVITLTTAGEQALQGVRRLREERLGRAIADHLTPEEQQTLIAALPLLERLADALS
jgi:DNA-binding MarR family transcriptional regulator